MIIKYAIALAILLAVAAFMSWAFLPARYLPGNRARSLRLRLHLRLHPGKGFATVFSLWLHWGRLAALRRSRRIRALSSPLAAAPQPARAFSVPRPGPVPARAAGPAGRAPAADGAAANLQDSVPGRRNLDLPRAGDRHHPKGRRVRPDRRRPGAPRPRGRVQSQGIGECPLYVSRSPVAGCEDPATAIRRADAFAFAVSQKGVEDGTFWSAKASDYLRGYFHAAALTGADLRTASAVRSCPTGRRCRGP